MWGSILHSMVMQEQMAKNRKEQFEREIATLSDDQKVLARIQERRHLEIVNAARHSASSCSASNVGFGALGLAVGVSIMGGG